MAKQVTIDPEAARVPGGKGPVRTGDIPSIVRAQREFFASGRTKDLSFRRSQLEALRHVITSNKQDICAALKKDMGKPTFEAYVAEVAQVIGAIDFTLGHFESWARPDRVRTPLYLFRASSHVRPEPMGVTLIIAPWNYPLDLVVEPLVGAIAAGNCAVIKPSEIAPATSALVRRMVAETFDPVFVTVVEGGPAESEALLAEKFDYIFFTGGTGIGKIVMRAASEHLTPVTLELGGKSPCIVEPDIDLKTAARRITWGKFFNAGQTCIAPDYLLVNKAVKQQLLASMKSSIRHFYGDDPMASPDYARIISDKHFERIARLIEAGRVVAGGQTDAAQRYIAPTILDEVKASDPVMQEEIFGPVLPVIEYERLPEALDIVNARERPLSLYLFTKDKAKQKMVLDTTSSGGACVNDTMVHYSNPRLPFGGVGASGLGRYHGKWSFDTFSNMRAVVERSFHFDVYLRYPPYRNNRRFVSRLIRFVT